ncbi:hypothetical protein [Mycolicibacterium holsaticum]|uniref:hypothetical protein n=1 Tax=Mycolicibacterium holsaticum TaxID=152142 RepID=UPI001C7CD608|nr:hypothetical protein [Mycolicibacterium holsaticum]QZA13085.1 hypothetical protein K3U96_02500 [Mycolicibacterium holsaticum DSM 44478 = JCM 12374]UNC09442.1 hypothetical protein H5U41_24325 [Mycolicibacterium holsaticum DSM 44478 = JCM 12374]
MTSGLVVAVAAGGTLGCSSPGVGQPARQAVGKPDITTLTDAMLVDETAFPPVQDGQFSSGVSRFERSAIPSQPPECSALIGQVPFTEIGQAVAGGDQWTMTVDVLLTPERPDLAGIVNKCGTIVDTANSVTATAERVDAADLPDWAVAMRLNSPPPINPSVVAAGLYRGVLVRALYWQPDGNLTPGMVDAVVKAFNDQVAKLQVA